jgi:hypothetical protein
MQAGYGHLDIVPDNVCLGDIADKLFPPGGGERPPADNVRRRRRLQFNHLSGTKKEKTSLSLWCCTESCSVRCLIYVANWKSDNVYGKRCQSKEASQKG